MLLQETLPLMPKPNNLASHSFPNNGPYQAGASVGSAVLDAPQPQELPSPATPRRRKLADSLTAARVHSFPAQSHDDYGANHQAELFYLQKQIQQHTQMIFVMEDGARIQGIIEWYDRHSIKVRGKSRVLIYKSAIKYLYKAGEVGSAPGE